MCIYIYIGEWNRTTGGGKLVFFPFFIFSLRTLSLLDISLLERMMSRPELSRIGSRLEVLHTPRRRCDDRNEKSYVLRVDRSMSRLHRRHVQCECTRCWGRKRIGREFEKFRRPAKFNGSSYEQIHFHKFTNS